MSHDLKAPLRSIAGFSQILKKKLTDLTLNDSQMFDFIVNGVENLRNLIDAVLQYSRFSMNEISSEHIDFEKLLSKLFLSLNYDIKKDNIEITKSNLSKIYGHEESLYLVFQNLISNAIKIPAQNWKPST